MDIANDNKGTSLVELVIAMMISAIIILMIMFFLSNASRSFQRTNNDVNIQMEAQTIINQLSNLVMEAEYMEIEGGEAVNSYMKEYSDSEGRIRYIFKHINKNGDIEEIEYNTIVLSEGCLYQIISDNWFDAKEADIIKEEHMLAEYVDSLVNIPNVKSVDIVLKLSLGNDSAELKKRVKFRNAR